MDVREEAVQKKLELGGFLDNRYKISFEGCSRFIRSVYAGGC